ncbi:MAG: hypothetical protein RMK29_03935 [Myxococcales bacterium]|nr:hypothetical protein [Myxococcota bacterium]MDW8280837.1 hypothetical protein [Myxococcales bacterium]
MRVLHAMTFFALSACAGRATLVQGGRLISYDQLPSRAERVYTSGGCHGRQSGSVLGPDDVEYEVHRHNGKLRLLEHSVSQHQARLIDNTWVDERGTHFFLWVGNVRGFEYVIPHQAGQPAERRMYRSPRMRLVRERGHTWVRPVGEPDVVCELLATREPTPPASGRVDLP